MNKRLKIGLMSAWNTDSGASVCAELIGRSFKKLGHELTVFSFFRDKGTFHGTRIARKDESYVKRCFSISLQPSPRLNPKLILERNYDVFMVNDIEMLPYKQLYEIFPKIKKKSKATINIIHTNKPFEDRIFYNFDFDKLICFDKRYKNFLSKDFSKSKISVISYPCNDYNPGVQVSVRKKLNLPLNKKIIFTFGITTRSLPEILPWIKRMQNNLKIMVLIVNPHESVASQLHNYQGIDIRIIKPGYLPVSKIYSYLYAADLLLSNKKSMPGVVLSSMVFQCLGSGCPIVAFDSNFVENLQNEVIKFKNEKEFQTVLNDIFKKGPVYQKTKDVAAKYVKKNSSLNIAQQYLELIYSLISS